MIQIAINLCCAVNVKNCCPNKMLPMEAKEEKHLLNTDSSVIFDICPHAGDSKHLNVLIDIIN